MAHNLFTVNESIFNSEPLGMFFYKIQKLIFLLLNSGLHLQDGSKIRLEVKNSEKETVDYNFVRLKLED